MLFFTKKDRKIIQTRKDQNPISLNLSLVPPEIEIRKTDAMKKTINRLHILIEKPDNLMLRNVSKEAVRKMKKRQQSSNSVIFFEKRTVLLVIAVIYLFRNLV
jgi:hypothetical protein